MARLGVFIALLALSATENAAAEKAGLAPQCAKQPGMIGDPIVATADTAQSIYRAVAKQRGDKVSPENEILAAEDGDHWSVFQHPKHISAKRTSAGQEVTTIVSGGGTLEMEIDKCTGAIRAHYSK